jgi:hypothetical protein
MERREKEAGVEGKKGIGKERKKGGEGERD